MPVGTSKAAVATEDGICRSVWWGQTLTWPLESSWQKPLAPGSEGSTAR